MNLFIRNILKVVLLFSPSIVGAEQNNYTLVDGRTLAPLERFRECDVCPEMVVVPSGSFWMGAKLGESRNPYDMHRNDASLRRRSSGEANIIPGEHPRHIVDMDIPFAIGRNEITFFEWMECVDASGCKHIPVNRVKVMDAEFEMGSNHPVVNVSWADMHEYVNWLNSVVGHEVYRLPTEAEWEYAARAGSETRFAQGDELTSEQANFSKSAEEMLRGQPLPNLIDHGAPVDVNVLNADNMWGIRHMSGNVIEVTLSCWSPKGHLGLKSDTAYLMDALSQKGCYRATKGGAFLAAMDRARLAARGGTKEETRSDGMGFRVVRQFK